MYLILNVIGQLDPILPQTDRAGWITGIEIDESLHPYKLTAAQQQRRKNVCGPQKKRFGDLCISHCLPHSTMHHFCLSQKMASVLDQSAQFKSVKTVSLFCFRWWPPEQELALVRRRFFPAICFCQSITPRSVSVNSIPDKAQSLEWPLICQSLFTYQWPLLAQKSEYISINWAPRCPEHWIIKEWWLWF